jgi:hypothetical protein
MAVSTVNEIVFNHLKNDSDMIAQFDRVYYTLNDNKTKSPYAVVYLIDDTKDIVENCPLDQGQARFQCEVYTKSYTKGINKRQIYQSVMKKLDSTVTDSFSLDYIKILNVNDSSDTINGLFNFNFETIVNWRQN